MLATVNVSMFRCMTTSSEISEAEIWRRTIQPENGDLSAVAAREWLRLRLSKEDVARVQELSAKANAGTLTTAEQRELENYLNVGSVLEFLKSKARLSLAKSPGG